ncbi:MAG: glycogen/starch synthase [Desulfobulbaceae bacterium]|nr:glycogen/starch synthase [Desulfobulbaceae bacterium]
MADKKKISNIWMLTREYNELAGAGGVKDVACQMADALVRTGCRVSVVLPLYGFMDAEKLGFTPTDISFTVAMNYAADPRREEVRIFSQKVKITPAAAKKGGSLEIYLIEANRYLEKQGVYTYTAAEEAQNQLHRQGNGHYDYFAMNVLMQKAALELIMHLQQKPQIIDCHDGHTAILPAMIREISDYRDYFAATACVVTIHNAGLGYHQEVDDLAFAEAITGLPQQVIADNLLDGKFDPFLAASAYATMNTVSENYARELQETDDDQLTGWLGHRLLARGVQLKGVTNGINPANFDPAKPKKLGLAAAFAPGKGQLAGKKKCRQALTRSLAANNFSHILQNGSLAERPDEPLFTFVGRFSSQKGVDILIGALKTLLPSDQNFQVLIMGSGSKEIEQNLINMAEANQGRVCLLRGFDPQLANQVFAAGDFFLIPSRYEPCGLTDYIAQLFGNLPVVHHIGGLVKVVDQITGFAYHVHEPAALIDAMRGAMELFRHQPEQIIAMQKAAIKNIEDNYTWDKVISRYLSLYQEALVQVQ